MSSSSRQQARERAREEAAARAAAQERRRRLFTVAAAVAAVLAIALVFIIVKLTVHSSPKATTPAVTGSAAAAVTDALGKVSPATLDTVGKGKVSTLPRALTGQPALTADGKPLVVYIGAEYCPFCAAERWSVVVALSRFGAFSNLGVTHSASADVFPNTATLSFHGASYTSRYLSFQGVETETNQPRGNGYAPLDKLSAQQEQLLQKYDAPPYVPSGSQGSIPFMDIGNRYVISGASFDPEVLAGKSAEQITAALANPADPITQAIGGSANAITAALCQLTNGQPAAVCSTPAATAFAGQLR